MLRYVTAAAVVLVLFMGVAHAQEVSSFASQCVWIICWGVLEFLGKEMKQVSGTEQQRKFKVYL